MAISDIFRKGACYYGRESHEVGNWNCLSENRKRQLLVSVSGKRAKKSNQYKDQEPQRSSKKADELIPILKASNTEVISAHVKHARGLSRKLKSLPLSEVWEVYSKHPDRATPTTVHEQKAYESTFNEFIRFVQKEISEIAEITPEIVDSFAGYLRGTAISVHTHNRKIKRIKRIKRIFETLKEYYDFPNPFVPNSLRRKSREEQEHIVKRVSFTPEQTQQLLEALEGDSNKVMNKPEIRVVYHLGMFTGQRLKDCVLLRWDKVDFKRKRIEVKQFKTGKEVSIPMATQLFEVLKEAKSWKENQYVCPNVAKRYNKLDKNGKNVGNNLVNIDVLRVIKWIGLEPSVAVPGRKKKVTVYGFHSLRHSFASHCAEAGVPKAVVVSILGANSEIVDKHYTHIGEEAQEKAINSLFGDGKAISAQEKLDKIQAILDSWEDKPEKAIEIENILRV